MPSPVIVIREISPILEAQRATNSSEAASLNGKRALTPIIAGSICGGIMFIAWTIGFAVYFRKRYNRKKRKRLIEEGKAQPREKDLKVLQEKVVIPPDPAVLLGQRKPGEKVFPERQHSSPGRSRQNARASRSSSSKDINGTTGSPPSAQEAVHHELPKTNLHNTNTTVNTSDPADSTATNGIVPGLNDATTEKNTA